MDKKNIASKVQGAYSLRDLENVMRLLYSQIIMWTRSYLISMASNIEDTVYIKNRLFMITKDMGNLLGIYYGRKIGETFERLFYNQLSLITQLIDVYIENGTEETRNEIIRLLDENTYYIARLFSQVNPFLEEKELEELFCCQIELIKEETIKRIQKRYLEDINLYDDMEYHTLMIADIITEGIRRQFYENS